MALQGSFNGEKQEPQFIDQVVAGTSIAAGVILAVLAIGIWLYSII